MYLEKKKTFYFLTKKRHLRSGTWNLHSEFVIGNSVAVDNW